MDKEMIRARLREVERRIAKIRAQLAEPESDAVEVRHDAYWASQELRALIESAR